MSGTLHIEVSRQSTSHMKVVELQGLIRETFECLKNPVREFSFEEPKHSHLKHHVDSINFCSRTKTYKTIRSGSEEDTIYMKFKGLRSNDKIEYHIFKLNEEGESPVFIDDDDGGGRLLVWHHCLLPSRSFHELWDTLILETHVKTQLLNYINTATFYSDKMVNDSLILRNKLILLHGPPGTGKTSLCKALAQKATVRLSSRFNYGQLVEINSYNLFSKYSAESAKVVGKIFDKIQEIIEDSHSIVFILIDDIENLVAKRPTEKFDSETSGVIRLVNAVLVQIDRIRKFPNVIILTTTNLIASLDAAFLDRADLKLYIGIPSAESVYEILSTSVNELMRVDIIRPNDGMFLPRAAKNIKSGYAQQLMQISKSSVSLSGRTLRKISFLTHIHFVKENNCTLAAFLEALEKAVKLEKQDQKSTLGLKPDPDYNSEDECEVIEDSGDSDSGRISTVRRKTVGRPKSKVQERPRRKMVKRLTSPVPSNSSTSELEGEQRRSASKSRVESQWRTTTAAEDRRQTDAHNNHKSQSTKRKVSPAPAMCSEPEQSQSTFGSALETPSDSRNFSKMKIKTEVGVKDCYVDLSKSVVSSEVLREYLQRRQPSGGGEEPAKRRRLSSISDTSKPPAVTLVFESNGSSSNRSSLARKPKSNQSSCTSRSSLSSKKPAASQSSTNRGTSSLPRTPKSNQSSSIRRPSVDKTIKSNTIIRRGSPCKIEPLFTPFDMLTTTTGKSGGDSLVVSSSALSSVPQEFGAGHYSRKSLLLTTSLGDSKTPEPNCGQVLVLPVKDEGNCRIDSPRTNSVNNGSESDGSNMSVDIVCLNPPSVKPAICHSTVQNVLNKALSPGKFAMGRRASEDCSGSERKRPAVLKDFDSDAAETSVAHGKANVKSGDFFNWDTSNHRLIHMTQTLDGSAVSLNGKPAPPSKVPQYNCDRCPCSFYFIRELKHHYASHLDTDSLFCQKCGREFGKAQTRIVHEVTCLLKGKKIPEQPQVQVSDCSLNAEISGHITDDPVSVPETIISTPPVSVPETIIISTPPVSVDALTSFLDDPVSVPETIISTPPITLDAATSPVDAPVLVPETVISGPPFSVPETVESTSPISVTAFTSLVDERVSVPETIISTPPITVDAATSSVGDPASVPASVTTSVPPAPVTPAVSCNTAGLSVHVRIAHEECGGSDEQYCCKACGLLCESEADVAQHEAKDHTAGLISSPSYAPPTSVNNSVPPETNSTTPSLPATPEVTSVSVSASHNLSESAVVVAHSSLTFPTIDFESVLFENESSTHSRKNSPETVDFNLFFEKCAVCGEHFLHDSELMQHIQTVHPEPVNHPSVPPTTPTAEVHYGLEHSPVVSVPEAENIIEVETTPEDFLDFLSAF